LFNYLNRRLLLGDRLARVEEEAFVAESIRGDALNAHVRDECAGAALIFLPYLYGTTYWGARIYPERSFLLPCLHDENYARMSVFADLHHAVRGLIFNDESEVALAGALYQIDEKPSIVVGMGVDPATSGDAERFRRATRIDGDVVCYFGRRDETKNTPTLIESFARYLEQTGRDLNLVLGGSGPVQIPPLHRRRIHDLGFVSEAMKLDACAASVALVQPSLNESFSIVMMESWLCGTPVLVNARCKATRAHCERSNGGLYFADYPQFAECLEYLLDHPEERAAMGRRGREYALRRFGWDLLTERLLRFLKENLD
jgi:glycosyltransferase involved in cell wall biosynthesis